MPKKNPKHLIFDSPVVLSFVLISLVIFIADCASSSFVSSFLACRASKGEVPFNFSSFIDYIRLILYVFGYHSSSDFFITMMVLLLLGPLIEERYGSSIFSLMIFVTSLSGGVLTATLSSENLLGSKGIAFMLIILSFLSEFSKGYIPASCLLSFILFFMDGFIGLKSDMHFSDFTQYSVKVLVLLASGISGSLFGFLASPKKRQRTTSTKQVKPRRHSQESEETIIGDITV